MADEIGSVERSEVVRERAGLHAPEVEQRLHEALQPLAPLLVVVTCERLELLLGGDGGANPCALLARFLVLDPVVGPELGMDTPVHGAANGDQYGTVISYD